MKGDGIFLFSYMEGSSHRYVIPVYQRRYDWKIDNCKQLYNDLIRLLKTMELTFSAALSLMSKAAEQLLNSILLMVSKDLQL